MSSGCADKSGLPQRVHKKEKESENDEGFFLKKGRKYKKKDPVGRWVSEPINSEHLASFVPSRRDMPVATRWRGKEGKGGNHKCTTKHLC